MARKTVSAKGRDSMLVGKRAPGHADGVQPDAPTGAKRFDPTDPASIVQFRKAAADFRKAHLGTQESARKVLASEGIYTPEGQLTKEYQA